MIKKRLRRLPTPRFAPIFPRRRPPSSSPSDQHRQTRASQFLRSQTHMHNYKPANARGRCLADIVTADVVLTTRLIFEGAVPPLQLG